MSQRISNILLLMAFEYNKKSISTCKIENICPKVTKITKILCLLMLTFYNNPKLFL